MHCNCPPIKLRALSFSVMALPFMLAVVVGNHHATTVQGPIHSYFAIFAEAGERLIPLHHRACALEIVKQTVRSRFRSA